MSVVAANPNEALVLGACEAAMNGDIDTFVAAFADDAIIIEPASLPYGGVYRGPKELKELFSVLYGLWGKWTIYLEHISSKGEFVFLVLRLEVTGRATNKRIAMPISEIWQIADGKAVFLRPIYGDTALACDALGVEPAVSPMLDEVRLRR